MHLKKKYWVCNFCILIFLLASELAYSFKTEKVWVFFTDKNVKISETQGTIHNPDKIPSERCLKRRSQSKADGSDYDKPLSVDYLNQMQSLGAKLHVCSRWLNAVSISISSEHYAKIENYPFVRAIQPVRNMKSEEINIVSTIDDSIGNANNSSGEIVATGAYGE